MCQTYETTISSLKYLDETKILMSSMLVILSLSISLLFNYGFGIMDYTSGQINTTQQLQQQQLMNQNESLVNASQMQENGSAGNLSNPCDTSYPDFCVTTYSANLTCMDIPHRNFTVLAPDTHGLDSDSDGLGCENSNVPNVNSSVINKSSNLNTTLP
jgi:hypothetical protein